MRLLREPLLHFLLLGALLFALYAWVNGSADTAGGIVVDRARADALARQFERSWRRPPTRAELEGLIDTWVREEVFYLAGVDAGMNRDDEVVRRRIAGQMTAMIEGIASELPSEAALESWLQTHAMQYRLPARYTLRQVYFDPARHGARLESVVRDALAALRRDSAASVGDATLLPERLDEVPDHELSRDFGREFSGALATTAAGRWTGPVRSAFGVHLVFVEARIEARPASLPEVRAAVERDLLADRARSALDQFYEAMRVRYPVRIEPEAFAVVTGAGILADSESVRARADAAAP